MSPVSSRLTPPTAQGAETPQATPARQLHGPESSSSKRKADRIGGPANDGPPTRQEDSVQTHTRFFSDGSKRIDRRTIRAAGLTQQQVTTAMIRGNVTDIEPKGGPAHSDSHFHPTDYVQRGMLPQSQIKLMDSLGMRHCVLMPIPTSLQDVRVNGESTTAICPEVMQREIDAATPALAGQEWTRASALMRDHHCGAAVYYIPKAVEEAVAGKGGKLTFAHFQNDPGLIQRITEQSVLYVDSSVNSHLAGHVRQAMEAGMTEADRSRLDPMITGVNLADIRAGEKFLKELYQNKNMFTGIGEITVHKELVQHMYADQRAQATTQSPKGLDGLKNLIEMAGVVGAPVVLHCDVDDLKQQLDHGVGHDREPLHFAGLRSLFTDPRLQEATVVWAHGGGLGRFVQEGPGHLDRLTALLAECPKLHLDISWSQVAHQVNRSDASKEAWTAFLEKNSERICFGSDALAPRSAAGWNETKDLYADVLGKLTPKAANDVLNGTYEKVFVAARSKVRDFEAKVLTPAFYENVLMGVDAERPVSARTVRMAKERADALAG